MKSANPTKADEQHIVTPAKPSKAWIERPEELERALDGKDPFEGEQLKRTGIAEVLSHTDTSWKWAMLAAAEALLKEGKTFTSEDLTEIVGYPPNHSSAIGAVMNMMVQRLSLKSHGRVNARHPKSHGAKVEVWGK